MDEKVIIVEEEDFALSDDDLNDEFSLEKPKYEVWALGYLHNQITDVEVLLKTFDEPDQAVVYAELVNIADIKRAAHKTSLDNIDAFRIEVETVVLLEDGTYQNAGTIHYTELLV